MATKIDIGIIITAVNKAGGAFTSTTNNLKKMEQQATRTSFAMRVLQGYVTGLLLNKVKEFGGAILKAAGDLQLMQIRLARMNGGAQNASKIFGELATKFGSSGFALDAVAKGFTRIQASGLGLEKTKGLTDAIVNSVAAFGGSTDELERVFTGFGQVIGKGTLQMEELRQQIGEAVPFAMRIMAEQAGVSVPKFVEMVGKGMVSADDAVKFFSEGVKEKFGNIAEQLGATIPGAMARVRTEFQKGVAGILENTTLGPQIAVIFNNIADAVARFFANIDQSSIDRFFEVLRNIETVIRKLLPLIGQIGILALNVFELVLKALASVPQDILEYGVIGYLILGKKFGLLAGLIGAAVGLLDRAVRWLLDKAADGLEALGAKGAAAGIRDFTSKSLLQRGFDAAGDLMKKLNAGAPKGENALGSIFGSAEDIKKTIANLSKLSETQTKMNELSQDTSELSDKQKAAMDKAARAAERLNDKQLALKQSLESVSLSMEDFVQGLIGTPLEKATADINKRFGEWGRSLEKAKENALDLQAAGRDQTDVLAQINKLEADRVKYGQIALDIATKQIELDQKRKLIAEQVIRTDAARKARDLGEQVNASPGFNVASGTSAGKLLLQVRQQKEEIASQVQEITDNIVAKQRELVDETDPVVRDSIEKTIATYENLKVTTQDAMDKLSASAMLQQELWQSVGASIEGGLTDAIVGLVNGTKSLGDVLTSVYADITQAAANYIAKLILMKTIGQFLPGFGSFMGGFADGGIMPGKIKPFANGGIIEGPTLFGLAGEAGTEAIMPLTRIGGKLGVQTTGGQGGNQYHININAIDTQTGLEFIGKHISDIDQGISSRALLNRSGRTRA